MEQPTKKWLRMCMRNFDSWANGSKHGALLCFRIHPDPGTLNYRMRQLPEIIKCWFTMELLTMRSDTRFETPL